MKILIVNGSPRGEKSNSMCLTNAFVEGITQTEKTEIEILQLNHMDIKPCLGCFTCWRKTPGTCCIKDDMASSIEKMLKADIIIWSFPLYYYGLPSPLKAFMDRQLPMSLPYMVDGKEDGPDCGNHPARYDMSEKKYVFISTCGFYTSEGNYDSVNLQLDRWLGKDNYDTFYCGEGELFRFAHKNPRAKEYLESMKKAGKEFVSDGVLESTREELSQLLYPREEFEKAANGSWN